DSSSSEYIESIKVVSSSVTKVSAPTLLETFNNWVTQQTSLPEHDHAMLFTSYDLIPSTDPNIVTTNNTRGLAYIGTVCQEKSVSLVEDLGAYQSENVATHELGHSLGALHDGDNNLCRSSDRYLMATGSWPQTRENVLHPWLFSSCSSTDIGEYLGRLRGDSSILSSCLLDEAGAEVNTTVTVSAQTICENFFGDGAFPCRNYTDFSEICTDLYCRLPDTSVCQQVVSASGTCCGNGKMCVAGNCTNSPEGECLLNDECPLGDQPSITLNGEVTTCGALNSSYCYIEDIRKVCCDTCQALELGVSGCLFGDKELGCTSSQCGSTFASSGLSYDFICCETCSSPGCVDKTSFNVAGTNYDCPSLVSEKGRYICYEQVVHVEFCCQECERLRDTESEDCPYGDRANCSTVSSFSQCDSQIQELCCETCSLLQAMEATTTTTIATTETTITLATTSTSEAVTTISEATTTTTAEQQNTERSTSSTASATSTAAATTGTVDVSTATTTDRAVPPTTAATRTGSEDIGYKPDGFQGCYLPPCSAERVFGQTYSSVILILSCLCLVWFSCIL
ncbi:hypothetical protein RRG08_020797, partial [Elysia crispata]